MCLVTFAPVCTNNLGKYVPSYFHYPYWAIDWSSISIDKLLSIYCHCLFSDYRFHWLIMPDHTGQMLRHFSTELSSFNCLAFVLQIQWLFWWRQYTRDIVPQLSLPVDSLCTTRPQCQRVRIWSHRGWYGNLSVVNFLAKLLVSVWIGTNRCI